jgi:hypothetical protein
MSNPARKRLPIVPPRVKVALQNLFADPKNDLAAAAATAGMPRTNCASS